MMEKSTYFEEMFKKIGCCKQKQNIFIIIICFVEVYLWKTNKELA